MFLRLCIVLAALGLAACDGSTVGSKCEDECTTENQGGEMMHGSGVTKTEMRPAEGFTAVRLSFEAEVIIEHADRDSLSVTGDDNLLPFFMSEVKDGTLYLSFAKGKSFEGKTPSYRVTVRDLRMIAVSGSGDVQAVNLDGDKLTVSDKGSGDIHLAGAVTEVAVEIDGSGDVDAANLKAKRAKVEVVGSGDVSINASDVLDAKIRGSGDIFYVGSPQITKDLAGSGSVRPKS